MAERLDGAIAPRGGPYHADVKAYLDANYGEEVKAFVEDPACGGAIMCPVCDLEMAIVYWPPDRRETAEPYMIIAFACDSGGRGHWLGVWNAGYEAAS